MKQDTTEYKYKYRIENKLLKKYANRNMFDIKLNFFNRKITLQKQKH